MLITRFLSSGPVEVEQIRNTWHYLSSTRYLEAEANAEIKEVSRADIQMGIWVINQKKDTWLSRTRQVDQTPGNRTGERKDGQMATGNGGWNQIVDTPKCFLMLSVTWPLGDTTKVVELETEETLKFLQVTFPSIISLSCSGKSLFFFNFSVIEVKLT